MPYLPNVIAGFDPRPWEEQGPSFTDPTRAEWAAALTQARDLVADPANSVFGLPDASSPTGVRPAISIYAWNELGVSAKTAESRLHHALRGAHASRGAQTHAGARAHTPR